MKAHTKTLTGAILGAFFATSAMAAEIVVLDSSAASLAPGSIIDSAASVDIPGGAVVTLIMADGETRTVAGPYSGPAGEARSDEGASALTASRGSDTKVLGAVRAPKWEQTN